MVVDKRTVRLIITDVDVPRLVEEAEEPELTRSFWWVKTAGR